MKYFAIGFNKTATCQISDIFKANKISSQHSTKWDLEKYDAFSDGNHSKEKFVTYYEAYPKSYFILNVRPKEDWIISRYKQRNNVFIIDGEERPPNTEVSEHTTTRWHRMHDTHFDDVFNFFKDKSDQLVVVDISKSDWIPFMCNFVGIEPIYNKDQKPNNSENFKINPAVLEAIHEQARPYRGDDFVREHPLLHVYKNNILHNI